ncbi:MAG: hypothetical protein WCX86_13435, partial [Candidatus Hydrogenedentales bacterium]
LNDKNTSGAMNRAPTRDSSSPHGAHRWRGQNGRDGRTWVGVSTCITQGLNDKNTSGAMSRAPTPHSASSQVAQTWRGQNGRDGSNEPGGPGRALQAAEG